MQPETSNPRKARYMKPFRGHFGKKERNRWRNELTLEEKIEDALVIIHFLKKELEFKREELARMKKDYYIQERKKEYEQGLLKEKELAKDLKEWEDERP